MTAVLAFGLSAAIPAQAGEKECNDALAALSAARTALIPAMDSAETITSAAAQSFDEAEAAYNDAAKDKKVDDKEFKTLEKEFKEAEADDKKEDVAWDKAQGSMKSIGSLLAKVKKACAP